MSPEEAKKISEEIEASNLGTVEENHLTEEQLSELEEVEDPEDDEYLEDGEGPEDYEDPDEDLEDYEDPEGDEDLDDFAETIRTEQITIVQQPVVIETSVGAEVGPKGEIRPFAKVSLKRHLKMPGNEDTVIWDIISSDFDELSSQVAELVFQMKEGLNEDRSERGGTN